MRSDKVYGLELKMLNQDLVVLGFRGLGAF